MDVAIDHAGAKPMPADNLWPTEQEEASLDRVHRAVARDVARGRCRRRTDAELEASAEEARTFRLQQAENERRAGREPAKGGG